MPTFIKIGINGKFEFSYKWTIRKEPQEKSVDILGWIKWLKLYSGDIAAQVIPMADLYENRYTPNIAKEN